MADTLHKVRRLRLGDTNSPTVPPFKWAPKIGVPLGRLKSVYEGVLATTDAFNAKRAEVAKQVANDKRLSDFAKQEKILSVAKDEFMRPLRRARHELNRARDEIEHRRASLKPKAVDPLNFAEALMRQEMRAHLFDMGEKAASFLLTTKDTRFVEAALSAPRELCGIDAERFQHIEARAIELLFPEQAADVAEAEEALEAAQRTLEVAEAWTLNEMDGDARAWLAEVAQEIDPEETQKTERERAQRKAAAQPLPTREELRSMARCLPMTERDALRSEIWDDTIDDKAAALNRAFDKAS